MKKLIVLSLFMLLVIVYGLVKGQNDVELRTYHEVPYSVSDTVWSSELDSIVLQLPTRENAATITQLKDQTVSDAWVIDDEAVEFDGFFEISYKLTNIDISNTDSLEMKIYPLDQTGTASNNDVVWAKFTTPPAWSSTQQIKDWADATLYRASLSGSFGEGTYGFLILTDINEETASQESKFDIQIYFD